MSADLRNAFDYFLNNQEELVEKYAGKFVVITNDRQVLGAFSSPLEASEAAQKKVHLGEFLVQKVQSGTDGFTQTFYSRVAFH